MTTLQTSACVVSTAPTHNSNRLAATCGILAMFVAFAAPAHAAVDGCEVMLCLSAPSWRQIPQCVPTIHRLNRDLARGRPFPHCDMAGAGNSSEHTQAIAPSLCPPQYTRILTGEGAPTYACDFMGVVTVTFNGAPFTRTWWSQGGDSVTEFSPEAKAQLGTWDARFDDDYAIWLASQAPLVPTCSDC